jgi:rubrerythrin
MIGSRRSQQRLIYFRRRQNTFRDAVMDLTKSPPVPSSPVYICDRCGTEMLDLQCKLRCTVCGFMRDCSDP